MEVINGVKTGRHLHHYLNPRCTVSNKAAFIHCLTNERLSDFHTFPEIAEELIRFIGPSKIVAHNANFDRRMINNELERCGWCPFPKIQFIDTLEIARFLYKDMKSHTQDALCKRFKIDNLHRVSTGIHSAMEDVSQLYHIMCRMKKDLAINLLEAEDFCKGE